MDTLPKALASLHYVRAVLESVGKPMDERCLKAAIRELREAVAYIEKASASAAPAVAPREMERTPQDYAIEHAEYMAKAGEHLLASINSLEMLRSALEEGDDSDPYGQQANAEAAVSEMMTGMREAIYEFRKRRDRAAKNAATVREGN